MRRHVALLTAASLTVLTAASATAATHSSAPAAPRAAGSLAGIPSGAPAAAYKAEPSLPKPAGWPFAEAFPRTSGTGRETGGASFWSDFVYDDHGAAGLQVSQPIASLAPTGGTYIYSDPDAHMNGADIFRAAVGVDRTASYWRIDWNTLVNRNVPIAEWALDTDNDTRTGTSAWPAAAGVSSPGIDRALVVSA